MITVTGAAASSIAFRNAVFTVLPRAVTDSVYNAAINKLTGKLTTDQKLSAKRQEIIKGLCDSYKISEEEVLGCIGKASVNDIQRDDIATLIGVGQAIKDGELSVNEAFRDSKSGGKPDVKKVARKKELERIERHLNKIQRIDKLEEYREHYEHKEPDADKLRLVDNRISELIEAGSDDRTSS
jgi:hypothetical protein